MKCWFFHKWSNWGKPYKLSEYGIYFWQQRKCLRCGKREEESV